MKATSLYIAIFALILLLVPMIALNFELQPAQEVQTPVHSPGVSGAAESHPKDEPAATEPDEPAAADLDDQREPDDTEPDEDLAAAEGQPDEGELAAVDTFLILDEASGEVLEVSARDYVRGAVAVEMPASFHLEALKAQAVAAHTFALHSHRTQQQQPDPALMGADFSADPAARKGYITEAQARAFYGENADTWWNKVCEAADSVLPYVLEYEGEPIVAAYHAISAGQTEDAGNVWEGSAPYLVPAESAGDLLAPGYESEERFSAEQVRAVLTAAYPGIALEEDPAAWFGEPQRSPSGYVTAIAVGDETLHGKDIREQFGLRSHNFDVQYTDAGFAFITYGYGHGVGLSQYGADFLARQGSGYEEILANYYEGTVLVKLTE